MEDKYDGETAAIMAEWPRFEDGALVMFGDEVHHEDVDGFAAYKVSFYADGCVVVEDDDGNAVVSHDGVFDRPKQTERDSWEKLDEDAKKYACVYWGMGFCDETTCPGGGPTDCHQEQKADIVRRAKKLAGVE